MIDKIINTEIEYSKCFSTWEENDKIIRFTDNEIEDMYTHNYTLIKEKMSEEELYQTILQELEYSKKNGKDFLQVDFHFDLDTHILERFNNKSEITVYEYYYILSHEYNKLKSKEACIVQKMETKKDIEESLQLDIRANAKDMGKTFIERRFERRSKIYKLPNKVDHYICYHEDRCIGHADLFMNGEMAKIEDFDVEEFYQRKGFGTSILKHLIKKTITLGGKISYVLTDTDDTAREMYKKCGFTEIGKKYSLLFSI